MYEEILSVLKENPILIYPVGMFASFGVGYAGGKLFKAYGVDNTLSAPIVGLGGATFIDKVFGDVSLFTYSAMGAAFLAGFYKGEGVDFSSLLPKKTS